MGLEMFLHVLVGLPFSDQGESIRLMEISVDMASQAPTF